MNVTAEPLFTPVVLAFVIILIVLLLLETLSIGLRLWVRLGITRTFGLDDWILISSHVLNSVTFAVFLWIHREQRKYPEESLELFEALSMPYLICLCGYISASVLVKFTIAAFFMRLVRNKWQKVAVIGPLAVYCLTLTGLLFVALFRCGIPVRAPDVMGKDECQIRGSILVPLGLISASLNAICDWAFALVPMQMLLASEKMDPRAKIASCIVVILAVLGSVISVIRIGTTWAIGASFGPTAFNSVPEILCLSVMETYVAGIAISLAVLKPLAVRFLGVSPHDQKSQQHPLTIAGQGALRTLRNFVPPKLRLSSPASWGRNKVWPVRGVGLLPEATTINGTLRTIQEREEADAQGRVETITEEEDEQDSGSGHHRPLPSIGEVLQWDEEAVSFRGGPRSDSVDSKKSRQCSSAS